MNKLKLFVLACFLMVQSATFAVGLNYGLEFGVSSSKFKFKEGDYKLDNNLGYVVGASLKFDLDRFGVGPELWFTHNAANLNIQDWKIKSNSITMPIVGSYKLLGDFLQVEAGPSFSLLNRGRLAYGDQVYRMGRIRSTVGYVLGLRTTIRRILMVNFRYNGCFNSYETDVMGSEFRVRTPTFSVSVGANF